ncbi:hypothetical protein Tco_1124024 [Tanacetum coccineum]|uniref:Uncharacterized protein n=1 Tax=Tanacetum coccineum TaxID=301880 RepID=A0ABQ5J5A1_9ASTR
MNNGGNLTASNTQPSNASKVNDGYILTRHMHAEIFGKCMENRVVEPTVYRDVNILKAMDCERFNEAMKRADDADFYVGIPIASVREREMVIRGKLSVLSVNGGHLGAVLVLYLGIFQISVQRLERMSIAKDDAKNKEDPKNKASKSKEASTSKSSNTVKMYVLHDLDVGSSHIAQEDTVLKVNTQMANG